MITVALGVALWECGCFISFVGNRGNHYFDMEGHIFAALFGGAIVGALSLVAAMGLGAIAPHRLSPTFSYPLVALKSQDSISGSFFLGSGQIGSDIYYVWYERIYDGGLVPHRVVASSRTRIYEEQQSAPELRAYESHIVGDWWKRFAFDPDSDQILEFHVPVGSVKRGFVL